MVKKSGTEDVTHPAVEAYVPSVASHGEGDLEPEDRPLSETVLCVRYNETAHYRVISQRDLSGDPNGSTEDELVWPGQNSELPWDDWEAFAGTRERALEVLKAHRHEFSLVGPGADELQGELDGAGEEEFAIGGVVA